MRVKILTVTENLHLPVPAVARQLFNGCTNGVEKDVKSALRDGALVNCTDGGTEQVIGPPPSFFRSRNCREFWRAVRSIRC